MENIASDKAGRFWKRELGALVEGLLGFSFGSATISQSQSLRKAAMAPIGRKILGGSRALESESRKMSRAGM
jgi:hypothetical protein